MRAVLCEEWCDFDDLKMTDLARPELGPGQARIAVRYAGVSFATTLVVAGKYQRKPPLPFAPGTEIAGEVLDVADGVTRIKPGDRVFGAIDWGGYAEEVCVPAVNLHVLPEELPFDAAPALAISYPTSFGGLIWRARLDRGETLLVHGAAGGVGLAAVEIGVALGATVIGVASSEEKRAVVESRGAAAIDGSELKKQVLERSGGVDVVYDPVGGDMARETLSCLKPDGRLVSIGYAAGGIPEVGYNILLVKNISVMGFNYGEYVGWGLVDRRDEYAPRVDDAQKQLLDWWQGGQIQPTVHARFPLEQFREAMAEVQDRRAIGRVVMEI
ncbi:MAG: quinone oxidoreductase [Rhodospirillaceae bacterium]|nr:quinone oxidoreductase [Rhodospirillaceae bacterium]